jgi:pyrroline-5-carboxylate reductase
MNQLRVCILGAGALGQAYALACARGGAHVTLLNREKQATEVALRGRRLTFPRREDKFQVDWATALPTASDAILVCVRAEQIDDALLTQLAQASSPPTAVIFVTPVMPERAERVKAVLPHAQHSMPSLIAEFIDGEVAYWVAPTPTLFSADEQTLPAVTRLIDSLRKGGVSSKRKVNLAAYANATTIAFFPIQLALLREPRMAAWRHTQGLLRATAHSLGLTRALAKAIGHGDPGLLFLMWVLSWNWILAICSVVLPWIMPRFTLYLGNHFGEKLRAQHVLLYKEAAQLGAKHGIPQEYGPLLTPVAA